jgi:hypothetical protein
MFVFCTQAFAAGQNTLSSKAAQLVQDERVIYTLPDPGQVIPSHPLFIIKQIKEGVEDALTRSPLSRIRLKIQQADQYISYAQALSAQNKPSKAIAALESSILHSQQAIKVLTPILKGSEQDQKEVTDLRFLMVQSATKHAEVIRTLLPSFESEGQAILLGLLQQISTLKSELANL